MIDALLFAVRNGIRKDLGYSITDCVIQPNGEPPPRCGDWFAAVHQGTSQNSMMNNLDERYGFSVTLTARVTIPLDRVGEQLLAKEQEVARKMGFNQRARKLGVYLHMAWGLLQDANAKLMELNQDQTLVYGFVEPAKWASYEVPTLQGGAWFKAEPDAQEVGIKSELRFEGARRLEPIATYC